LRAALWRAAKAFCRSEGPQLRDERMGRRRLEIDIYLTKVREWTKASCKAFAASIAL
jgi:hypothetical protein